MHLEIISVETVDSEDDEILSLTTVRVCVCVCVCMRMCVRVCASHHILNDSCKVLFSQVKFVVTET